MSEAALNVGKPHLTFANSVQRPEIVAEWGKLLLRTKTAEEAAKLFWPVVLEEWAGFDAIDHGAFSKLFAAMAADRPAEIMSAIPRAPITIYRGGSGVLKPGLSWTTNIEVARQFARGHRGLRVERPEVLTMTVKPHQIAFVTNEREEDEVVLIRRPSARAVRLALFDL